MPATAAQYVSSVVGSTGTWSNLPGVVGSSTGTNATTASSTPGTVSTLTVAMATVKGALPSQPQTIDNMVVRFFHNTSTETTAHTVTARLSYGGVLLGTAATTVPIGTSKTLQTITLTGANLPMYAQLDQLRVVVSVTRNGSSGQNRTYTLDTIDIVVNYTAKSDTSEYTIFEPSVAPTGASVVGTGAGGVLGHEFFVSSAVWARGIRFYRPSTSVTGTVRGRLYTVRTGTLGDVILNSDVQITLSSTPASGWFEMRFPRALRLQPGQRYRVAVYFPSGRPDVTNFWSTGGGSLDLVSGAMTMMRASTATGSIQEQFNVVSGQGTAGLVYPNTGNSSSGNACIDVISSSVATSPDIGPQYVRTIAAISTTSSTATSMTVPIPLGGSGQDSLIVVKLAGYGYPSATDQGDVSINDTEANLYYGDFTRVSSVDGISKIWSCINRKTLVSGDSITVNFPAGSHNLVMTVEEYNGVTFTTPSDGSWRVHRPPETTGTGTTPSHTMLPPGTVPYETLIVGSLFIPSLSTETYTEDTDTDGGAPWTMLPAVHADGSNRQQTIQGAYKMPVDTRARSIWNPVLGTNRTWIAVQILYRGAPDRTLSGTPTPAENRVVNPRFTDGLATGWAAAGLASSEVVPVQHHVAAAYALQVVTNNTAPNVRSGDVNVDNFNTVYASYDIEAISYLVGDTARITLQFYTASTFFAGNGPTVDLDPTLDFQRIEWSYTGFPAGTIYIRPFLVLATTSGSQYRVTQSIVQLTDPLSTASKSGLIPVFL